MTRLLSDGSSVSCTLAHDKNWPCDDLMESAMKCAEEKNQRIRADAETIRSYEWCNEGLADNALAFFRENIELREQLAAQSAELEANAERIRAVIHRMRWYADDGERPDEWLLKDWANELERALAAHGADTQGEKG